MTEKLVCFFFNILPFLLIGQVGPGGVLDNTNNVFWVKADAGVYNDVGTTLATNTQNIRQWNDYSGNSKHFSETMSMQQPMFITNSINGFPVVRFDGNNDRLSNLTITSGNTANFFTVIRYSSLPNPNPGIFQGSPSGSLLSSGANDKAVGMWISNANKPWGRGIQSNNAVKNIPAAATTSANTSYIIENEYSGVSVNQYVNASISGSVNHDGSLKSWTEFSIGRQAGETWAGDIAEVIAFNTNINLAQRNIVYNYLSAKYNIAISASADLYNGDSGAKGNYDFEVGGIGQSSAGNINNSFSTSVSGGVGISYVSGFQDGDYILAGHNLKTGNTMQVVDCGGMTGVQNQRWSRIWCVDITDVGPQIITDVSFDMSDGGLLGVVSTNPSNYVLLNRMGVSGNWSESIIVPTISGDKVTFSGVSLLDGYYTLGVKDENAIVLPIQLISFIAKKVNNNVLVSWKTATEINNDYFTIERSFDGQHFTPVTRLNGAGNSTQLITYSVEDKDFVNGLNYYKLIQTDYDGNETVSDIIAIDMTHKSEIKIKTVNLFGQEVNEHFTGIVYDVYSDGSLVKRIQ